MFKDYKKNTWACLYERFKNPISKVQKKSTGIRREKSLGENGFWLFKAL